MKHLIHSHSHFLSLAHTKLIIIRFVCEMPRPWTIKLIIKYEAVRKWTAEIISVLLSVCMRAHVTVQTDNYK